MFAIRKAVECGWNNLWLESDSSFMVHMLKHDPQRCLGVLTYSGPIAYVNSMVLHWLFLTFTERVIELLMCLLIMVPSILVFIGGLAFQISIIV